MRKQLNLFGDSFKPSPKMSQEKTQYSSVEEYVEACKKASEDLPIIVSYGGGRNSTALLVAMAYKGIVPDAILFSDTGGEHPKTYEYIEFFDRWLEANNFPKIQKVCYQMRKPRPRKKLLVRRIFKTLASINSLGWLLDLTLTIFQNHRQTWIYTTLEEECVTLKMLPSKAYGAGKCSAKWKVEPLQKKAQQITNNKLYSSWVGIHSGESSRVLDKSGRFRSIREGYGFKHYPLIEWGIDQSDCEALIRSAGLPVPRKSSCFFCPNMRVEEVRELKRDYPELYERAVYLEENADLKTLKGLGRIWAWGDLDKLTPLEELALESRANARQCDCID